MFWQYLASSGKIQIKVNLIYLQLKRFQTYPADCRKIAAVDSNKHDWDWTNRTHWKKKDFCTKIFFKSDLFWWYFVVEHTSVS